MNHSNEELSTNEIENRELLYSLYIEIMEEIHNKKINIDNEEYIKKIATTSVSTLIFYIKESINLLVTKRIEFYKNEENQLFNKKLTENEFEIIRKKYENQLRYLENQLRYYMKKQLYSNIEKDAYEAKIKAYMEIKDEYDEMREKFRYEKGKFMDNEKKENEIEILRKENCNLKNYINKLEKEKKNLELKKKTDDQTISDLKNQLEILEKKITIFLENDNENSKNSNINININNNLNQSSKLVIKQHNDRRNSKLNKRNQNDSEKSENFLSDIINTKSPLNSNYKHSINATKQKHRTNSTGSINEETKRFDLISKYCNNNNIMRKSIKSNSNKISKKTLFSIHKKQKYEDFLTYMSKMYLGGNRGSRSANRSTMRKKD